VLRKSARLSLLEYFPYSFALRLPAYPRAEISASAIRNPELTGWCEPFRENSRCYHSPFSPLKAPGHSPDRATFVNPIFLFRRTFSVRSINSQET